MLKVTVGALVLLLAGASVSDLVNRSIPNLFSLSVALIGLLVRFEVRATSLVSLWCAALLIIGLVILFSQRLLGGGDVKLMAALSLALSAADCYRFICATIIFGGLLAIIYLVLRRVLPPLRCRPGDPRLLRIAAVEASRIRGGLSLPYGVAIAAAGTFVLLNPTHW